MKRLTCEMCGSTDLIKQDGVFVCQSCGCKYSVEEAKKMMIEGTVEVAGTVKVDDSAKIQNYLELSQNAYAGGNGQSAFDYANKALEIAPQNSNAWIAKMKSIEYIGTLGDLKLTEVAEAGKNAVTYASESDRDQITHEVYLYEAHRTLDLLKLATAKMDETTEVRNTLAQFALISILTAASHTSDVDSKVISIYDNIATEAVGMLLLIPDEVLGDYIDIADTAKECAEQYQSLTTSLSCRLGIYHSELSASARNVRDAMYEMLFNKANVGYEKSLERERIKREEYWNAHKEELDSLNEEKNQVEAKIKDLEILMGRLPEKDEKYNIKQEARKLRQEMDSLGIFKGKEKKRLQEQIDQLEHKMKELDLIIKTKSEDINEKIIPLKMRKNEIELELNKDR